MESYNKHIEKYKKNKEFIKCENIKSEFKEWYTTGAFYCSLHLIEGYLAKFKNEDVTNHKERLRKVCEDSVLRGCFTSYKVLYHESIKARYYDKVFVDEDIQTINDNLKKVEDLLIAKLA